MIKKAPRVSASFPLEPKLKKEALRFIRLIKSSQNVLISSTYTSDGDSIGGQLGLYELIRAIRGKKKTSITIVDESPVPYRYQFLANTDKIMSIDEWDQLKKKPVFDLGIVCDGGIERAGRVAPLFDSIPQNVLVDHHAVGGNLKYAATLLDRECSSTCELVYHLFEFAKIKVSKALAEALYVGIVFDTGFFKHSLTKPRTHLVAAKLVETGIDFSKISDRAILERSWGGQQLLKLLLAHMERTHGGKVVSSAWSKSEMDKLDLKDGDQEGMINQLYYTEGSEVVVLFVEKEVGDIKLSFRSKGAVNVAELARSLNPQGGGHIRAAGCSMKGSLAEVRDIVFDRLTIELR